MASGWLGAASGAASAVWDAPPGVAVEWGVEVEVGGAGEVPHVVGVARAVEPGAGTLAAGTAPDNTPARP